MARIYYFQCSKIFFWALSAQYEMLMSEMIQRFFPITIISITLISCNSSYVTTDFETSVDFSELRYYTWLSVPDSKYLTSSPSPMLAEHIINAVDGHLGNKNFKTAQSPESADILVKFVLESRKRTGIRRHPFEFGPALSAHNHKLVSAHSSYATYQFTENSISVEFYLRESLTPVWRGTVSNIFTRFDTDVPEATLKKVIDDLLKPFPPPNN